jgi:hypothetical protein
MYTNIYIYIQADFPLPPSQIFIRCLAKNATVRKELTSNKANALPIWAMLLAVVTGIYLYIYICIYINLYIYMYIYIYTG